MNVFSAALSALRNYKAIWPAEAMPGWGVQPGRMRCAHVTKTKFAATDDSLAPAIHERRPWLVLPLVLFLPFTTTCVHNSDDPRS
jgi:hypothetical protein